MCNHIHPRHAVLMGVLLFLTLVPAVTKADQIVLLVDEKGNKVFVNTSDTSTAPVRSTKSLQSTGSFVAARPAAEIDQLVEQTAARFHVDPELVRAVIRVESGFNPKAVSDKGAMGLMQLIPATAQRFGVADAFDPKQNIEGGVNYLKYLLDMFGGDLSLSLAAYNAGEHAVQRSGGIPAIPQTQDYVRKVTSIYQTGESATQTKVSFKEPPPAPITRSVDQYGVVHFSNVD
jgi:hypothetical protein